MDRSAETRLTSPPIWGVSRALNDPRDITHNLRTAIVDGDGRIVKVYTGNDWSPKQALADLETLAAKT